jgi:hypothetical protein
LAGVAPGNKAGVLTCDVSAGGGLIPGSQKYRARSPRTAGRLRRQVGLDLGIIGGGVMVWTVFTRTVAGPGFLPVTIWA